MNAARSFYTSDVYVEHYLGIRWPARVWAAVLEQAIRDVVDGPAEFEFKGMSADQRDEVEAHIQAAAEDWVADNANEPRRFVWVCEQLGLAPDAVRRSIDERRRA